MNTEEKKMTADEMTDILEKLAEETIAVVSFEGQTSKAGNPMIVASGKIYDGCGKRLLNEKGYKMLCREYLVIQGKEWLVKKNKEILADIRKRVLESGQSWDDSDIRKNYGLVFYASIYKENGYDRMELGEAIPINEIEHKFLTISEDQRSMPMCMAQFIRRKPEEFREIAMLALEKNYL